MDRDMNGRQKKRRLCCILVFCMLFGLCPTRAWAVSQEEIDALRAERNAISAQREEKQAVVDQLEEEHAGVLERKQALDERNTYALQEIQNIGDEIALYDDMIADKQKEVDEAQRLEDEQLERLRARVRAMEENGNLGFLALIFNTSDLGELLTTIDDIGEILKSDQELEARYIAAREQTEAVKAEYEAFRSDLEGKQADLRLEQTSLELQIKEAAQLMQELKEDIDAQRVELDEIVAAENEADARIEEMVAEMEAQRQAAAAAAAAANGGSSGGGGGGGGVVGSGSFIWPVSSTYITSRFGLRVHPVTGVTRNHNGLDIGEGYGGAIHAADGGTAHTYYDAGGYGNYIMIDHGNGYQTLYGHMSSYAISDGQSVSQGQVIGYVGDTGLVTGPHLHFEIWSGGGRIDPEQFFGGLTFAPDAGE